MQARWKLFCALVVVCGVLLTSVKNVDGRPRYKTVFGQKYAKYYKYGSKQLKCRVCHRSKDDGKPDTKKRNNYGRVVRKLLGTRNEQDKTKVDMALQKAEDEPSGIRGKTFGDLIKAGFWPATGL